MAETVSLTRRDPAEEGDEPLCGCHTWLADQMACMVVHDGIYYSIATSISSMLGHHLTKFVRGKPKIASVVKDEAMRWLLVEGANLFRMAVSKFHESCEEEDIRQPTPDEARDWFCWLYRHVIYLQKESHGKH